MTQTAASPPPNPAFELAEVTATRLCHDLAGTLGTLMGALELAGNDARMMAEALPLAGDAARQLAQRLRLLRTAWGGLDSPMRLTELRDLAAGLPGGKRTSLRWDGLPPDRVFTPDAARLLLNVLMLATECLHGAGELAVAGGPEGDVIVTIDGPRAAWPDGFAVMLTQPATAASITPRDLQAPLTAALARRCGIALSMLLSPQTEQAPPLRLAIA